MSKFLLDTDVFVQAKNLHYRMDFCMGFWNWVSAAHANNIVYSIKKVRAELVAGKRDDPARLWAEALPSSFFLEDENDSVLMGHYATVVSAVTESAQYQLTAKNVFADYKRADAFLIAAGARHSAILVTHEKGSPEAKRRVPIPDAANLIGVTTRIIFELLGQHAGPPNFEFKP